MTKAETTNTGNEGTGFFEFLTWLEVNKQKLIIGGVTAIVVGFGIYVWNWAADQKEQKAMAALMATRPAMVTTNTPPTSASEFMKVRADYPKTRAAELALVLAAGAHFSENNYSEAQNAFRQYISEYGSGGEWSGTAELGVAASLEAANKPDEALKAYQDVVSHHPNDPVAPQAKLALARIYESKNQPEQAYKLYEELAKPSAPSSATSEAFMRRAALMKKHPNLGATNAPAATVNPTKQAITISNISPAIKVTPASNATPTLKVTTSAVTAPKPAATAPTNKP